jgi:vacuolar-type H+-ATPase subunit H
MSVYRVLDKLEGYVHEGTWLPAGYRILSEERLVEMIEKIRSSLPEEVGRAKIIADGHDRMIRAAQEKAESIVSDASSKQDELVDQNEIVQRARTTAEVVLREAEERARKIREGADHYAVQVLGEMEARMSAAVASIRKGRESLTKSTPAAPAAQPLADAAAKAKRAAFDLQTAETSAAVDETAAMHSVEA